MNLKQKAKTYSFWISLVSAILIIIRVVCQQLGLTINESYIMDIVTGICGVLVLLGILVAPTKKEEDMDEQKEQLNNNLTNVIKQDITNKTLSIAEQIEMLSKKAENNTLPIESKENIAEEESDKLPKDILVEKQNKEEVLDVGDKAEKMQNVEETVQKVQFFDANTYNNTENAQQYNQQEIMQTNKQELKNEQGFTANTVNLQNDLQSLQDDANLLEDTSISDNDEDREVTLRDITISEIKDYLTDILNRL